MVFRFSSFCIAAGLVLAGCQTTNKASNSQSPNSAGRTSAIQDSGKTLVGQYTLQGRTFCPLSEHLAQLAA